MLAKLAALKGDKKAEDKPKEEENLAIKFNVLATDKLTRMMSKKLKQDVNIEYK